MFTVHGEGRRRRGGVLDSVRHSEGSARLWRRRQILANAIERSRHTIYSAFESRSNNFDVLRLLAALAVLVSHSYFFTGTVAAEPFLKYFGGYETGGGWGVATFFVISGFLVTRSVLTRETGDYLAARALRIVPALIVVSLFTVFVIGPLTTALPLPEYFSSTATFSYLANAFVFKIQYSLPGVFEKLHDKAANGSLWTLPIEASFYVILPILFVTGLLKRSIVLALYVVMMVLYAHGLHFEGLSFVNQGVSLSMGVTSFTALHFGLYFVAGSLLWLYRDRIPLSAGLAFSAVLLLYMGSTGVAKQIILHIALPYLVIYAALYRKAQTNAYDRIGDVSYGVYIYAMPVQQSVVYFLGSEIGPTLLTSISLPAVLLLAFLSWRYVERVSLKQKGRHLAALINSFKT